VVAGLVGCIRRGIIPDFKYGKQGSLRKRDASVVKNMNTMNGREISLPEQEGQIEKEQFQARLVMANQEVTALFKNMLFHEFGKRMAVEKKTRFFKKSDTSCRNDRRRNPRLLQRDGNGVRSFFNRNDK
jgi:hypothetical protein